MMFKLIAQWCNGDRKTTASIWAPYKPFVFTMFFSLGHHDAVIREEITTKERNCVTHCVTKKKREKKNRIATFSQRPPPVVATAEGGRAELTRATQPRKMKKKNTADGGTKAGEEGK